MKALLNWLDGKKTALGAIAELVLAECAAQEVAVPAWLRIAAHALVILGLGHKATKVARRRNNCGFPPVTVGTIAPALLLTLVLAACASSENPQTVSQPATVRPVAETGQGGTDAAAAQFFGFATTRPASNTTPLGEWQFPGGASNSVTRPVVTLRRKLDPTTGKVVEEWYEPQLDKDGKPLMESAAGGLLIDARFSTFTNSVTPQGTVSGASTTQSGGAAPNAGQTSTQTTSTSVPVTANVPVTLPNGTTIPAGGVIPAGTPTSVFPTGAVLTPVK